MALHPKDVANFDQNQQFLIDAHVTEWSELYYRLIAKGMPESRAFELARARVLSSGNVALTIAPVTEDKEQDKKDEE